MFRRIISSLTVRFCLILFLLFGLSSRNSSAQQAARPTARLASASVNGSAMKVEAFTYGLTKASKVEANRPGRRGRRQAAGIPPRLDLTVPPRLNQRVRRPGRLTPSTGTPNPSIPIEAPDFPITGRWTGTVTQGSTVVNCTMDTESDPGGDGPFSNAYPVNGSSTYSTQDGKKISMCDFVGAFWKNELRYQESGQIEPLTMNRAGLKQGDLWLSSNGTHLAGQWIARNGSSGTIHLEKVNSASKVVNIFIGGFFDATYKTVKSYFDNHKSDFSNPIYFSYDARREIRQYIAGLPTNTVINLIGHSYGGDTAAIMAVRCGKPINLLITIDPVSWVGINSIFGPSYSTLTAHAAKWIDVNATGGGIFEGGNLPAGVGGAWNTGPSKSATIYYEVPKVHADFEGMMEADGPTGRSAEQMLIGH